MKDSFRKLLADRFVLVWSLVLIAAVVFLGGRALTARSAPTLEQVLTQQAAPGKSPDPALLIASLLALSLATMSAAKGYEMVRRSRSLACAVLPEPPAGRKKDELLGEQAQIISGLKRSINELSKVKEWLQQENTGLKERLGNLTAEVEEIARAEKMLRKSNISLSKECERLKAENEMLLLKISSLAPRSRPAAGKKRTVGKRTAKKRKV